MFHRWIDKQMAEIGVEDYVEPEHEIDPEKDHLLGEMDDDLKKLYTLCRRASQEKRVIAKEGSELARQINLNFPTGSIDSETSKKIREMERQLTISEDREAALWGDFWLSVREKFPPVYSNTLAVCKGFKVVSFEEKSKKRNPHQVIGFCS